MVGRGGGLRDTGNPASFHAVIPPTSTNTGPNPVFSNSCAARTERPSVFHTVTIVRVGLPFRGISFTLNGGQVAFADYPRVKNPSAPSTASVI